VRQYGNLISLYPDFTGARIALGTLQLQNGRIEEAARTFDHPEVTEADPLGSLMLAVCYANLKLDDDFRKLLRGIGHAVVPSRPGHTHPRRREHLVVAGEGRDLRIFHRTGIPSA